MDIREKLQKRFKKYPKKIIKKEEEEEEEWESDSFPHQLAHSVRITDRIGMVHGDTTYFDDLDFIWNKMSRFKYEDVKISSIKLFGDQYINGIQIIYNINGETIEAPIHTGNHHSPKEFLYNFEKDEEIISISGNIGVWMDSSRIITNKREYRIGFSDQGEYWKIEIPKGCRVLSICGGFGGHIHNLGLTFVQLSWNPQNHRYFSSNFKKMVKTIMMISFVDRMAKYPQTSFGKLPRDILYLLFKMQAKDETSHLVNYHGIKRYLIEHN